jgi:hypothetical protein
MTDNQGHFSSWPGWNMIAAIGTCVAASAAIWGVQAAKSIAREVIVLNKVSPPFAVVSSEGRIIYQDRISDYQLRITKTHFTREELGRDETDEEKRFPGINCKYIIHLKKPAKVLIFSQDGAAPKKRNISPTEFEVTFIGVGWGNPIVSSEFMMQVLESSDSK